MMFNYGAFPQTWEDPSHISQDTGKKGDNDPLDVVEIGMFVSVLVPIVCFNRLMSSNQPRQKYDHRHVFDDGI
jgi:inorganic pyrophosphatase